MVTPTYYVYFTSTTIITSAVLFQGFNGTAMEIVTVVMGFLTICAGVVLLQLSKSAKDVPDTAVFAGDLDQIHTIAEQEQPETEPKADAIRGAAAIVRRFSVTRQKMEEEEFRRLHEEKEMERLAPVSEDGSQIYEWDGLRRRRTTLGSHSYRSRAMTSPSPVNTPHLPLGRSRFPTPEELEEERSRPVSPGMLSSITGTIRSRARSILLPGHPDFNPQNSDPRVQSPMHPVQLTNIAVPGQKYGNEASPYGASRDHIYGLPDGLRKTEYAGAASIASGSTGRHVQFTNTPKPSDSVASFSVASLAPPTPPPHGEVPSARRQFSFQNVFRRHQADSAQDQALPSSRDPPSRHGLGSRGFSDRQIQVKNATEEERLGLVKGDSHSMPALPRFDDNYDDSDSDSDVYVDDKRAERYGRGITSSPTSRGSDDKETGYDDYDSRRKWGDSRDGSRETTPQDSPPRPLPGRRSPPRGGDGAFI